MTIYYIFSETGTSGELLGYEAQNEGQAIAEAKTKWGALYLKGVKHTVITTAQRPLPDETVLLAEGMLLYSKGKKPSQYQY